MERAALRVSGVREKRKCWPLPIEKLAADIETNGPQEKSKVFKKMDKAKVEDEEWQTVHAGSKSNRGEIFTVSCYQGAFASGVCSHHKSQKESSPRR